jgi:hypothetical protein
MPIFNSETGRKAAVLSHGPTSARHCLPFAIDEPPQPTPSYLARRLNRVRFQLDAVDTAIEAETRKHEPDGQRLNWLAQAQERLAEQERLLDGRPLPGSMRPASTAANTPSKPFQPAHNLKINTGD